MKQWQWTWTEAKVDQSHPHIEFSYGKIDTGKSSNLTPIGLLGPPSGHVFPVQFLVSGTSPTGSSMVDKVKKEIEFLLEYGGPHPWSYAQYQCSTTANWYGDVHWSLLLGVVDNWNNDKIKSAQSKRGVLVTTHPFDNLFRPEGINWPPIEVVQKMYKSRQEQHFEGLDARGAKYGLGFYCDLQSLHSEDAITWSVIGTVSHSSKEQREAWVGDFFRLLGLDDASPAGATMSLWRRMPHPDTLVPSGPEIDFVILTENTIALGESKWQSRVSTAQGKKKDKDQIQLRGELLSKYGKRFFPGKMVYAIVGISLLPGSFINKVPQEIAFGTTTWDKVCSLSSHPYADEVKRYFEWKKKYSQMKKMGLKEGRI
jgi:hypothetical protein